jgi:hypothetical protein
MVTRSGAKTEMQLRGYITGKFNESTVEHCGAFYRRILGYLQKAELVQEILE